MSDECPHVVHRVVGRKLQEESTFRNGRCIRCGAVELTRTDSIEEVASLVVQYLEGGYLDSYLERILAAAHDRKRELRNVLGFRKDDPSPLRGRRRNR